MPLMEAAATVEEAHADVAPLGEAAAEPLAAPPEGLAAALPLPKGPLAEMRAVAERLCVLVAALERSGETETPPLAVKTELKLGAPPVALSSGVAVPGAPLLAVAAALALPPAASLALASTEALGADAEAEAVAALEALPGTLLPLACATEGVRGPLGRGVLEREGLPDTLRDNCVDGEVLGEARDVAEMEEEAAPLGERSIEEETEGEAVCEALPSELRDTEADAAALRERSGVPLLAAVAFDERLTAAVPLMLREGAPVKEARLLPLGIASETEAQGEEDGERGTVALPRTLVLIEALELAVAAREAEGSSVAVAITVELARLVPVPSTVIDETKLAVNASEAESAPLGVGMLVAVAMDGEEEGVVRGDSEGETEAGADAENREADDEAEAPVVKDARPLPVEPNDALFCPLLLTLALCELDKAALADTAAEGEEVAEDSDEAVGRSAVPLKHAVAVGGAAEGVLLSHGSAVADTVVVELLLCEAEDSNVAVAAPETVRKDERLCKDEAETETLAEEVREALGELLPTAERVGEALAEEEALEDRDAKGLRDTPAEAVAEEHTDVEKEAFDEREEEAVTDALTVPLRTAVALAGAVAQEDGDSSTVPDVERDTSGEVELLLCGEAEMAAVRDPNVGLTLVTSLRESAGDADALVVAVEEVDTDSDDDAREEDVGWLTVGAIVKVSVG